MGTDRADRDPGSDLPSSAHTSNDRPGSERSGSGGPSGAHSGSGHSPGDRAESAPRSEPSDTGLAPTDPLEHPDPVVAADAAALENLLRCWVRETGLGRPVDGVLRVPLAATGATLHVPVRHWSAVGCHRFDPPTLDTAPEEAPPLEAVALAALIGREAAHGARSPRAGTRGAPPESAALVGRVADSLQRTAHFLAERRARPRPGAGTGPFLDGEQALLFGHPLHPTPKSREGLSEAENRVYAPELRGSFPVHWMAADESVLAGDSAWTDRGKPVAAADLSARLAGRDLAGRVPHGCVPLPLHPWQARELRHSGAVRALMEAGLLHDLGPAGEHWHPTSSVRTVYRPDSVAMLKLSLGLRITNSRRENLRKELLRGVEVHRLLRGGLGTAWRAAHPNFDIVRDPAWLGVDEPGGGRLPGFDTVIRHNPFRPHDDAVCVAGLTAPVPGAEAPAGPLRSRLARVVTALAERTGRPRAAVSAEWFLRYLHAVVLPILWLDARGGIALEAHQQNTLVLLDRDGWPQGGRYRDNQGYYFRASRRDELDRRLPGVSLGVASDSYVDDEVTDERFAYYLGINNVLGLIGAFGSQGLADERLLLAAFRRFLERAARGGGGEPVSRLPALLLESPTLRCKANLLTRLHGMDELVGPVDTQSVYVTLDNPLTH
ncbi:IucA/IucC family protein [Streptomyces iconiensis]|uniref:IucA/IucC family protein n=1 Tax=Streptomyces iconiensis TaxID=1384038 RepID=UPI003D2F5D86